jgi:branched-chain amino acid aminotransferase
VLDPRVKSLNYLNNVLAKAEARRHGADDALLLNGQGHVAEASVANVFIVLRGKLFTPPTTDGCLDGITRGTVLELAESLGISCAEKTLSRIDLLRAEECFVTGTGAGLVPVASLDGESIGQASERPVTARIQVAYAGARSS